MFVYMLLCIERNSWHKVVAVAGWLCDGNMGMTMMTRHEMILKLLGLVYLLTSCLYRSMQTFYFTYGLSSKVQS
jgi:hypothetical protein